MMEVQPVSPPCRTSPLDDVDDAAVRAVLAAGQAVTLGPATMLGGGGFVVAATWDGRAFRTFGAGLEHRATTATWHAALVDMLTALAEWGGAPQPVQETDPIIVALSSPR